QMEFLRSRATTNVASAWTSAPPDGFFCKISAFQRGSPASHREPAMRVCQSAGRSGLCDKAIDDALLAGLVELDRELVAVDHHHLAISEFLVKDAIADRVGRGSR